MRRSIFTLVMAAGLVGCLPLAGAESPTSDGDLAIDQLPAPARDALRRQAGGHEIRWVQRGVVDGKTVYTARIRQPGLDQRVVVGEDGRLVAGGDLGGSSGGGENAPSADAHARVGDSATTTDHVGLNDVPAAVKATIERVADGRDVASIARERRDGVPVYRARLAGEHEIVVDDHGGVIGGDRDLIDAAQAKPSPAAEDAADRDLQKDIALDQAPQPVQDTLRREAGGEAIRWVQRDTDDGQLVYRARIRQEGLDKRVTVAPDGKLLESKDFSQTGAKAKGAWEKTKEGSKQAWEATKEGAGRAWDKAESTVGDYPKLEDLPAAVRSTIEAKAGDREIRSVKHELKDGKHVYDAKIHVKDGPDEHVIVDESGGIVEGAR